MQRQKDYHLARLAYNLNPSPDTEKTLIDALNEVLSGRPVLCFREKPENDLTKMELSYEKLLVTVAECGCPSPRTLTIFELYTWVETLKEKYEAIKEATNAAKRQ